MNIALVGEDQRLWYEHAREVAGVEIQMKALIPEVTADTEIFAYRFVLEPSFTPSEAAVWYDEPGLSGGSLAKLLSEQSVDNQTYVLDTFDGTLYNAMPGLQINAVSSILWRLDQVTLSVAPESREAPGSYQLLESVTGNHSRRIAVSVIPPAQGWLSLQYQLTPEPDAHFTTEIKAREGTTFRVRMLDSSGREWIAYHHVGLKGENAWLPMLIPLTGDGDSLAKVVILEAQDPSGSQLFFAPPRLASD